MSEEYIKRGALCKACGESITKCNLCVAKEIPAADVVEVKHGTWEKRQAIIFDSELTGYRCSECKTTWDTETNYCPNCGADMWEGHDENPERFLP